MKLEQILDILEEYYLNSGSEKELEIILEYLQELGSLSYFYWLTKQWEDRINKKKSINANAFQTLMIRWFSDCLDLQFSKV